MSETKQPQSPALAFYNVPHLHHDQKKAWKKLTDESVCVMALNIFTKVAVEG